MKGFFAIEAVHGERPGADLLPKCGRCGLFKTCASPKIPAFGEGLKQVLIVGEAPDKTDDEEGRPFAGDAGEFLRRTLSSFGVKMDRDATLTNALICHPPKGAVPKAKQVKFCRANLLNTLQDAEPRVIVTLGRSALQAVLHGHWKDKLEELERWVGWQIPLAQHWICPTYHPTFVSRAKSDLLRDTFSNHLEAAFSIETDPPPARDFKKEIELIFDSDKVFKILRDFDRQGGWIAFDYEANCLKPFYPKAKIYSCSVSNGERTIAYPWAGRAIEATSLLLQSDRTQKIASNMKMEESWTQEMLGHPVTNWGWDTMLAAHVLDNRPGICSLKFQSFVKFGIPTYNSLIEGYLKGNGSRINRIHHIDFPALLLYNGTDSIMEHELAMLQRKEMGYAD